MFEVGDVVACVDVARRHSDCEYFPWTIRLNAIYRIIFVYEDPAEGTGVNINVDPPELVGDFFWHADRFRKIEPAEPQFVELIRRIKVPEPA